MFQRARFSCIAGYYLDGVDDIVCTSSGYWSHPPPKCKGKGAHKANDRSFASMGNLRLQPSLAFNSNQSRVARVRKHSAGVTCSLGSQWEEKPAGRPVFVRYGGECRRRNIAQMTFPISSS